jgi:hypothetical protein
MKLSSVQGSFSPCRVIMNAAHRLSGHKLTRPIVNTAVADFSKVSGTASFDISFRHDELDRFARGIPGYDRVKSVPNSISAEQAVSFLSQLRYDDSSEIRSDHPDVDGKVERRFSDRSICLALKLVRMNESAILSGLEPKNKPLFETLNGLIGKWKTREISIGHDWPQRNEFAAWENTLNDLIPLSYEVLKRYW